MSTPVTSLQFQIDAAENGFVIKYVKAGSWRIRVAHSFPEVTDQMTAALVEIEFQGAVRK